MNSDPVKSAVAPLPRAADARCWWRDAAAGCTRIGFGLGKLVLLAFAIMPMAGAAFDAGEGSLSTFCAWVGVVAYSLGFYFGFSGGIDVVVGVTMMLGQRVSEGFDAPYHASSVSMFWQRWTVPLVLGSTQHEVPESQRSGMILNMLVVLLVTALWHGISALNAVAWLLVHALLLAWERWSLAHRWVTRAPNWMRVLLTYLLVTLSWVVLRTSSLDHALRYFAALAGMVEIYETAMLTQARMLTDYPLITLAIAACVAWLASPSMRWLRVVTRGKAIFALLLTIAAIVLLLAR